MKTDKFDKFKPAPLWKWIMIILLVIAMPLFFWFIRNIQMQQALMSVPPEAQQPQNQAENIKK